MTEEKKNELLLEQVTSLMQQTNNDVIAVICNRIKTIGEMSATDAIKLSNMARTTDLKEIEDILAKNTELSKKAVDEIVEKSAENNDELSAQYYKYAGKTKNEKVLETIKSRAKKSMSEGLINLSDTTAFIMDGKPLNIRETYAKAINSAIYATQQGLTDYNTAIRTTVRNLADSGLRVVDFDSGYHRRLDSQARMNILDGMRQLNQEYRKEQGQEFGADGVEISVHGMCAPDHQDIQGQQYSKEDFEKLQSRLLRPIGTLNCQHTTFPIILGVSKPAYTKKRLKEIKAQSNAPVQYTDKLGNDKVVSAYDSTQKQREQETIIRRLKDRREAFRASGDDDEVAKLNKQITAQSRYYRKMSAEVGLEPKMERTRVIKAKVKKDPANVAKFVKDTEKERISKIGFSKISDGVKNLDEKAYKASIDQIGKLEDKFNIIHSSASVEVITENNGFANAFVRIDVFTPNKQSLSLCPYNFNRDTQKIIDNSINVMKSGYHMPFEVNDTNALAYSVTHEYGHMIENLEIWKRNKDFYEKCAKYADIGDDEPFSQVAQRLGISPAELSSDYIMAKKQAKKNITQTPRKIYEEIEKIGVDKYGKDFKLYKHISEYGNSNVKEAFAEMFANSQLGKPNEAGECMSIWLERNDYGIG